MKVGLLLVQGCLGGERNELWNIHAYTQKKNMFMLTHSSDGRGWLCSPMIHAVNKVDILGHLAMPTNAPVRLNIGINSTFFLEKVLWCGQECTMASTLNYSCLDVWIYRCIYIYIYTKNSEGEY
jgi:hypothetical protein